ncbi:hypothetical protein [Streptomyces sp. NPDC088762]|uniref:hypothetical protein n=1 Tax=Streptomyces sp. NPDC088762 TaxID=3365891 RepID=UPI00382F069B
MTDREHTEATEAERADLYELARETDRKGLENTLTAYGIDPAEIDLIIGSEQ